MNQSVADLRQDYTFAGLEQTDLNPNPVKQFETWFKEALLSEILEPNAMTLATATPDGKPSARIVLLKGFDERGFVFYTNYESQKGKQLIANPQAELVFFWDRLERQIRIEGKVTKISPTESDAYFQSRPKSSQIAAWTSNQSQVISSREVLEQKQQELESYYAEADILPRPEHWGGFRLEPETIEFWQGRPSRLHDRLVYYLQADGTWLIKRLAP
ncbi:MAG: pyridoxamine 5'-phosphate oxidase [Xenococcaceae cyanobacterium MO_207.B15]|nr:pyridoxamine 5'-phosphate oxidase [Xenococcaceae cyanobacterium MO_207.B15]